MFETEGAFVLSIRRDWNRLEAQGLRLGRKVKDKDIILFNQELVALLKAGYPILKSLETITARVKNIYLKEILIKVAEEVKRGKALSEAFLPYERLFSPVYTASLMAGEKGGNLPGSIGRYIQYTKVVTQTRTRIKSAMTYPTILIVFSFILMGILVNFVLPQFADFYKSFEAEMPGITRMHHVVRHGPEPALVRRSWPSWPPSSSSSPACGGGRISAISWTGPSSASPSAARSGSNRASASSAGPSAFSSKRASPSSRPSASPSRPSPTPGSSGTCRTSPTTSRTARACPSPWPRPGRSRPWPWT